MFITSLRVDGVIHYHDETIGLIHPFYNDLRSRGTGIVEYENTGVGNGKKKFM